MMGGKCQYLEWAKLFKKNSPNYLKKLTQQGNELSSMQIDLNKPFSAPSAWKTGSRPNL